MRRSAFLLGLYSIGGQVLLLRELVSAFNGDELLIGTALFGWLVSVAAGAFLRGKSKTFFGASGLFVAGALLLPAMIVVTRLAPTVLTNVTGEIVPLSVAGLASIVLMLPTALISGGLFTSISNQGVVSDTSIVRVYLFEGIGAFAGGLAISLTVGVLVSTLATAVAVSIVTVAGVFLPVHRIGRLLTFVIAVMLVIVTGYVTPAADRFLESLKYPGYEVRASSDTHYGHQSVLFRDGSVVLMTDNMVEARYPDQATSENLLIPPLLYHPDASRILFIGKSEFGVMQLAHQLSGLKLTSVDPRAALQLADLNVPEGIQPPVNLEIDDPVSFAGRGDGLYDIVIVSAGSPDNYRNARLVTPEFLTKIRGLLADGGILFLPTPYDTDRYLTPEVAAVLKVYVSTLGSVFDSVACWPGEMTLLFAGPKQSLTVSLDSLARRTQDYGESVLYLQESYLRDRLSTFKTERLEPVLASGSPINSLYRPILPYHQLAYRSGASDLDKRLIPYILSKPVLAWILPILMLGVFAVYMAGRDRYRRVGLLLYGTAGMISLSLELISFYVYQSLAGTLYSELAALVGSFMCGLAVGTYLSQDTRRGNLAAASLAMMLVATGLFSLTFDRIAPGHALVYHMLFQFAVASATGALFVSATVRYYDPLASSNRGIGYAVELVGSSAGALLTTAVFLPMIGLHWLLISIGAILILAFLASVLTTRA